jgi:hypothetical protein
MIKSTVYWSARFMLVFFYTISNRICGVMVSVLASSAVDCGLEPRSGQFKDYEIGICCYYRAHHT